MLQILQGDWIDQLRTLPEKSVQCCVTSPPYWGLRDYKVNGQLGLEKTPVEYVEKLVAGFREVRRVLKDDGTIWVNLGDSYNSTGGHTQIENDGRANRAERSKMKGASVDGLKPKDLIGIPWRVAFALQADGWYLRSDIIWAKPNPMPESVTDRPTKAHEYIFLLSKKAKYFYDAEAIKQPVNSGPSDVRKMLEKKDRIDAKHFHVDAGPLASANHRTHVGIKRAVGGTRINGNIPGRDDGGKNCNNPEQLYRNKRSVWTVATSPYSGAHFATFPPDLIKPCILAGSKPGDTILDPFFGSGTTGMVSLELGRKCIGIELNPEYMELEKRRCDVTPGLALT